MPKTKISEYSATANSNTDVASINIDEGCAPSGINNAIRAVMGHLKDFQSGTSNDPFTVGSSGSLTLSYGTANGVAYLNGSKVLTTGSALTFDGTTFKQTAGSIWITGGRSQSYSLVFPDWYIYNASTGGGLIWDNGSEQMRLTSTGLGIGTSSPAYKLDVTGAINATNTSNTTVATGGFDATTSWSLKVANASTTAGTGAGIYFLGGTNSESWIGNLYESSGVGALSFQTRVSGVRAERMRIDNSGNLLVGTTTASGKINAVSSTDQHTIRAENTNSTLVSNIIYANATRNTTNGSFNAFAYYNTTAATYKFYVIDSGAIYSTSTSITAISDQTLKTNVRDLETGLTEVMALKPRRFDWINGDAENVAGFVAQEVEQVLPELVSDYKYSENVTKKALKMGDMLPTLVKAIQELKAEVDSLKSQLNGA